MDEEWILLSTMNMWSQSTRDNITRGHYSRRWRCGVEILEDHTSRRRGRILLDNITELMVREAVTVGGAVDVGY